MMAEQRLKALVFDFGGTLAFLEFELLARAFSREGLILDALALEHAEYAGRAAIDRFLGGAPEMQADDSAYAHFFRAWMSAAGIAEAEIGDCALRFGAIHREATLWRVGRPGTFEGLEAFKLAGDKLANVWNSGGKVMGDAKRFRLTRYLKLRKWSH